MMKTIRLISALVLAGGAMASQVASAATTGTIIFNGALVADICVVTGGSKNVPIRASFSGTHIDIPGGNLTHTGLATSRQVQLLNSANIKILLSGATSAAGLLARNSVGYGL